MEAQTKHRLVLGAGAIAVCGVAYYLVTTQGDNEIGSPMTIGGGGLGGFGDLFRKLLGAGAALGLGELPGLAPISLPELPIPSGQLGVDVGDLGYTSPAPSTSDTNTFAPLQFSAMQTTEAAPLEQTYSYIQNDPVAVHEAATLPIYGPRPEIGPADPHYELTQYALASPENPGGITQSDIANLGNYEGSPAQLLATTGTLTGSPETT